MILKDEITISRRYIQEEQDFIRKIKKQELKRFIWRRVIIRVCTERKMNPELDFLPTEKEMYDYISSSLKRILGDIEND